MPIVAGLRGWVFLYDDYSEDSGKSTHTKAHPIPIRPIKEEKEALNGPVITKKIGGLS